MLRAFPSLTREQKRCIADILEADANLVDAAVQSAKSTFESGVWSKASVDHRKHVLLKIKDLILANQDEIAHLECTNTGVPIAQVSGRQIARSALNFEFFAEYISQSANPIYDQNPNFLTYVRRDPVGVAGLIAPWNAPMALASMKIAGAIAFGNSCVFKPSELTPFGFMPFMDLVHEAGLPPGVLNLVNGRGPVTGAALTSHPDVDVIAFTGGTRTGRIIGAEAARTLKKTVTELGGKSAFIIFEDADFDRALDSALIANFSSNGQQCLAGSRILVHQSILDKFTNAFVKRVKNLIIGDPFDPKTEIGPLISKAQYDRVLGYADKAHTGAWH